MSIACKTITNHQNNNYSYIIKSLSLQHFNYHFSPTTNSNNFNLPKLLNHFKNYYTTTNLFKTSFINKSQLQRVQILSTKFPNYFLATKNLITFQTSPFNHFNIHKFLFKVPKESSICNP